MACGGRYAVLAVVATMLACDDPVFPGPEEVLTEMRTSAHGVYHFAPGDAVAVEDQEAYYDWLLDLWGVQPTEPFVYFKYRSRAHMKSVTGKEVNGWAEGGTYRFHSIWPIDNHECVHSFLTTEFGTPPSLINEGLAVAHQSFPPRGLLEPHWGKVPIDTLAAHFLGRGEIPPLGALLRSRDFSDLDPNMTYPVAGSFVKSVLERHGYERMKAFLRSSGARDEPDELRDDFRAAFGEELDEAWARWLDALQSRPIGE